MKNSPGLSHHQPSGPLVNAVWGSNIRSLFKLCNEIFFLNTLHAVEVFSDSRMNFARGYCHFNAKEGKCWIALSEPLLKARSRKDLVESLLHEMVHAYLYMYQEDQHGIISQQDIHVDSRRTNRVQTIESNRMEVQNNHQWVCNGVCRNNDPNYGVVTKAVDLSPGPQDAWWWEHAITCGGVFTKVPSVRCRRRLLQQEEEEYACPVCCNIILEGSNHIRRCLAQAIKNINFNLEECAICGDRVNFSAFKTHLKNKISNFVEFLTEIPTATTTSVRTELNTPFGENLLSNNNEVNKNYVHCPVCLEIVNRIVIQEHADICVNKNSSLFSDSF